MLDSFGKAMPIGDKPLHSITWSTAVYTEFHQGECKVVRHSLSLRIICSTCSIL